MPPEAPKHEPLQQPDPLTPTAPEEMPQPHPPVGVPAPTPDVVPNPTEPPGVPATSPTEEPQPIDPRPSPEI